MHHVEHRQHASAVGRAPGSPLAPRGPSIAAAVQARPRGPPAAAAARSSATGWPGWRCRPAARLVAARPAAAPCSVPPPGCSLYSRSQLSQPLQARAFVGPVVDRRTCRCATRPGVQATRRERPLQAGPVADVPVHDDVRDAAADSRADAIRRATRLGSTPASAAARVGQAPTPRGPLAHREVQRLEERAVAAPRVDDERRLPVERAATAAAPRPRNGSRHAALSTRPR